MVTGNLTLTSADNQNEIPILLDLNFIKIQQSSKHVVLSVYLGTQSSQYNAM